MAYSAVPILENGTAGNFRRQESNLKESERTSCAQMVAELFSAPERCNLRLRFPAEEVPLAPENMSDNVGCLLPCRTQRAIVP